MTILRATKDDSKAILTPFEQGAGEGDWRRYQTRVKGHGKVLSIDAGQTTSTTLVVDELEVLEGDQLYLQEGLDAAVKPVVAGVITDTLDSLDILGDGSCLALYKLDNNASDAGGNYNGTWAGTEQYAQAVYGQGALFDGSSYISSLLQTGVQAFSFSIYIPESVPLNGIAGYLNCNNLSFLENIQASRPLQIATAPNTGYIIQGVQPERGVFVHYLITNAPAAYINGVQQTISASDANNVISSTLQIGRASTVNCKNGTIIDQVRLYNKNTFTQSEVDKIYAEAQEIDISSAGFTDAPTRAVLKAPSIDICLEDEARRCISADYNVPITQAFNDTIITSLPEFNATTRDCLDVGDEIALTVDGSPVTTEILTIDKTTPDQYTITFAPQPTQPTACVVPSRAVVQTNPTPVGDWDGDNMTLEYDAILKQGRALEISVHGDNTHEIAQVNVDLYKEVI